MKTWKRWTVLILGWGGLDVAGVPALASAVVLWLLAVLFLLADVQRLTKTIEQKRLTPAARSPAGPWGSTGDA